MADQACARDSGDKKRQIAEHQTPTCHHAGETPLNLIELVSHSDEWDDDDTAIYAVLPWTPASAATLVSPAPETTEPVTIDGVQHHYFLETFIAREVLESVTGSDEARCGRLIAYAINDA
jgi:hypothetical protein